MNKAPPPRSRIQVSELKKKTKGYRRAETLTEWLQDAFFEIHASLCQQRPLIWHLASNQVRRVPAFGILVHAHKAGTPTSTTASKSTSPPWLAPAFFGSRADLEKRKPRTEPRPPQ